MFAAPDIIKSYNYYMSKTILCFVIGVLGYLQGHGQTAIVDSIRSLVQKINTIATDTSCKKYKDKIDEKITEYKTNISKIHPTTLGNGVAQFLSADNEFLNADYNFYDSKGCRTGKTIVRIISNLDTLLNRLEDSNTPDSVDILRAMLYVKNKYSGFVSLRVLTLTDSNAKIENPGIILHSIEPFIIPPGNTRDSQPVEIFIRPGAKYLLSVTNPGYSPDSLQLFVTKDTVVNVRLKKIEGDAVVDNGDNNNGDNNNGGNKTTTVVKQGYLWIPAAILVLALFVLGWKFLSSKKKYALPGEPGKINPDDPDYKEHSRNLEVSIMQLNEQLKEKDTIIKKYSGEAPTLHSGINLKKMEAKYFLSEIMMTAGPRKPMKNSQITDKDLGEDVCGFIMSGDEGLVWILDGASDYTCLRDTDTKREYFSSRLLAQSIARKLKSHFTERKMDAFDKTMLTILSDVKSNWLNTVNSLPESQKNVLKSDIKSGVLPECSSTVLIGRLSLNGDLNVYRVGDCKMLAYSASGDQKVLVDSPLATKNSKSFDWIFFRLVLTDKDEFDIQYNQPLFEIVTHEKIQTIIGFSDGVGQVTQDTLKKEYPKNSDAMRNEIIYQLQGTGDDKSLCIIEIKE